MRLGKLRKKLYLLTYDKQGINKKALRIKKSMDEVKHQLSGQNMKQK